METLSDLFHALTDVETLVRVGGIVGMFAIVFAETGLLIGFFLPGDSLLVTAGLFASRGMLDITALNVALMIAAIAGDAVGYWLGRRAGASLFERPDSRLFKRKHLERTHEFYERHGGKTIVIARFMPIARTFAPVVAGIAGMGYRRFAVYNVLGGIGWVFSMTMLGYLLGAVVPGIDRHIEIVILVIIFLSILPGVIALLRARFGRRAESAGAP